MTEAVVTIKGRNDLRYTVQQAERDLKGLLKTGELFKKALGGGAIIGAALAFERLAENAQKAAEAIGDKGTARSLRLLNKEIDSLKSKGINIIGRVLGGIYGGISGDPVAAYTDKVKGLRKEIENQLSYVGGNRGKLSARALELVEDYERQLRILEGNRPAGDRLRAPGSRGGGQAAVLTEPPKPGRTAAVDPMDGLSEANVWQRQIFSLRNEQAAALAAFSEESRREVAKDMQQTANETTKMLGTMSEGWKAATEAWTVYADQAARNMQDAFAEFLFDPFAQGIDGMLKGFVDVLRRMLAEYVAFQAFSAIGGALAGSGNAFVAGIGTFLKGARAGGGPVMAGGAYLVGEKGPEMFVPQSSGNIVPNHALGGVTMNYSIDARGADAERIMAVLPAMLKRTKDETVAAVMDLTRRGRLA
jgi:hypothetical protein